MSGPSRLRFVAAQIGPKPGKKRSLTMLLDLSELPGDDWKMLDQRTWRTGIATPIPDWTKRANEAGSVTAWRSFGQKTGPSQTIWTQVTPFVSADDAQSALTDTPKNMMRNLWAEVSPTSERVIEDYSIPDVTSQWFYEQEALSSEGASTSRFVAATVAEWLFVVACAGLDGTWIWADVITLASTQARKIRKVLRTT